MCDKMMDIKLIEEFDGTGSVVEWLNKVELVAKIRKLDDLSLVIPLRLTKGAFAVYQQLPDAKKSSGEEVKKALIAAFAVDQFTAYDAFVNRKLQNGESVDVYLADLQHYASLFGGVPDQVIMCAFVNGLPDYVKQTIRAGVRLDNLKLVTAVSRARAVLVDTVATDMMAAIKVDQKPEVTPPSGTVRKVVCHNCGLPNHISKYCAVRKNAPAGAAGSAETQTAPQPGRYVRPQRRCFGCGSVEHFVAHCPGNKKEGESLVPVSSSEQK